MGFIRTPAHMKPPCADNIPHVSGVHPEIIEVRESLVSDIPHVSGVLSLMCDIMYVNRDTHLIIMNIIRKELL